MKRAAVLLLALLCIPAPAVQLRMTQPEAEQCEAEGGCTVISQAMLHKLLMQAHRAGMATCESEL